jgi:hypothetical protein
MMNQSNSNSLLARRVSWPLVLCAVVSAAGCGAVPLNQKIGSSETHVDSQATALTDANQHLQEAQNRLSKQPDPRNAGAELKQGIANVQTASAINTQIRQDVQSLGSTAQNLQTQLIDHQNDWLGPRARRLRNHILIAISLLALGAGLLWLGPMFGGPIGGAAIVAGHLLTAFTVPIWNLTIRGFSTAWNWLAAMSKSTVSLLSKLGGRQSANATQLNIATSSPTTGAIHAPTGSD